MTRRYISWGTSLEEEAGYSRAVVDGDWVFVSGVTGFDYETMRISSDVTEQAEQCFRNIEKALQQGGCRLDEVVRVTYILAERADFARLAPIFGRHFGKRRPAATAIVAGMIDPRMKIEIEVTALRDKSCRIDHGG